jgi:hypothetical protein
MISRYIKCHKSSSKVSLEITINPKAKEKSYGGHVILPFTEKIIRSRAEFIKSVLQ